MGNHEGTMTDPKMLLLSCRRHQAARARVVIYLAARKPEALRFAIVQQKKKR